MAVYQKAACPKCGKLISLHPLAWGNHDKACTGGKTVPESPKQPAPATEQQPVVVNESKKINALDERVSKISDPKLRERMRIALDRQAQFEKAPELFVADTASDVFMKYRQRYLPESIPDIEVVGGKVRVKRPALKHEYFGDPREVDSDVARGYVPIIDEHGQHVCTPDGMYMYETSQKLHLLRTSKAGAEAHNLARQGAKTMTDKADGSGGQSVADGVTVEHESVTQEKFDG